MPYIKKEQRQILDPHINELATAILYACTTATDFPGMLNYVCTRLTVSIVRTLHGRVRYWVISLVSGVFHNIADEFYRRVAAPYEDEKLAENGDVYDELL